MSAPAPDRSYQALVDPRCTAVVVHCSDPRYQTAFQQFIGGELALGPGAYMPLVVSGGAGVLAHPERLPKEFKFMKERLEFYRAVMPSLNRVVLINHQACRYYQALKRRVLGAGAAVDAVAHDELLEIRAVLARTLPRLGLEVELYYARFTEPAGSRVAFERVGGVPGGGGEWTRDEQGTGGAHSRAQVPPLGLAK